MGVLRTVLLDIAANLLCVAVVLLAVLARPAGAPVPSETPLRSDAPVGAAATVEALRLRASRSDVATIDLAGGEVRLVSPGALPQGGVTLRADARALPRLLERELGGAPGPVELFVFDHAGHGSLRTALGGRAVREHDVPFALRSPDSGWSQPYRRLWGRSMSPETFRDRLAAVLRGGQEETEVAPARSPPPASVGGLSVRAEMVLTARLLALALALWAMTTVQRRFSSVRS